MQRYHAASCSSAVNNNSTLSGSVRDSRVESSSIAPNYSLNSSRRPLPLTPYKLKCDRDSLNTRLGPPDYYPQNPHCAEETLPKEYVLSGYKEAVEGLEESREISLSQIQNLTKPVISRCREALRKYHRAINESRAQKRKAGQVYGVPLSGNLLTKPCSFPELRPCGEEFRKKWIEGLSQRHKRLCTLADHVPHGYRRKSLFEILIRNNVPLLRATWFIKITYLNQVRPGSSSYSTGLPDRTPISRSEQWTKDIIDYLQGLLDEFLVRNDSMSSVNFRDRSPQVVGVGSSSMQHHRVDPGSDGGEEPSLHFKWWYVVRLLQCHHAEGLILPSLIIDWVFNQLQEKPLLGVLQLLLPVIYGVINAVVLCQTYVRTLVGIAIRYIQEPSPGGSDLVDNSRRAYTISALVEMLRYLIFAVPDNFVALDCFPLPSCVVNQLGNDGNFLLKAGEKTSKRRSELQSDSVNSLHRVVSSVQKCTETLARGSRPGHPGQNFAKALQALDKSLVHGDMMSSVYRLVFENLCDDGAIGECWFSEVSSCLRSTLTFIGGVPLSLICAVFLICEWATCDFRDFRAVPPSGLKFSGRKDISQIYIAMRLLNVKNKELRSMFRGENDAVDGNYDLVNISKHDRSNIFGSSSPLHDIVVCWIDQHQVQSEGGVKHLQLLITELIRAKIFCPQAYVRQLLVSGITDSHGVLEYERRKRHHRILKQLPSPYVQDVLEEDAGGTAEESVLSEAMTVYSNERRLVLHGLLDHNPSNSGVVPSFPDQKPRFNHSLGVLGFTKKKGDRVAELEYLKASISALLQLPAGSSDNKLLEDFVGSNNKRSFALLSNKVDVGEGTPGCEECRKVKRQKLIEDKNSYLHKNSPNNNSFDDDEFWWVKKGQKPMELLYKADPPKPAKQAGRGRQKVVRKMQSLAQLAASRIEGSQGASTSHVCDNKVICPHHRSGGAEVDAPPKSSSDGIKTPSSGDLVSIGKALKKMRFTEKRAVISWMVAGVKQQLEEAGKTTTAAKVSQYGRPPPSTGGDRNAAAVRWKLGEDELSYVLYLMDISSEIVSAVRFLLWLLPKALSSATSINGVRNILMLPRNSDNLICEVGEAFLISSIRRFENVIAAADLVPETLSAAMHRVTTTMASTGRISGSAALAYARHLWKKYSNVASVVEWEKTAKSTYDKRLMSELESGRLSDFPLGVPAGVEDLDDFFRQKISGVRVSRVGLTMQRQLDEVFRKIYGPGMLKNNLAGTTEKSDDGGYQTAQQVVMGLMDCMRQTGGAAQEGDPSLVSSAISAILSSVGQVIARIPDLTVSSNHLSSSITTSNPLSFARRVLRVHVLCLCLLKDALGERQSRVFEVALAAEACNVLVQVFVPGKGPRSQYQMSPDPHDSIPNNSSDILNSMTKVALGRTAKITGAISALVIGTILQGITNLERMVCLLRLREGLDPIQFLRSIKSNSNGNTRSIGVLKQDSLVEVSVHWFRVLVGNCRTVSDGFIVDLLGEASVISLSRMQRALPINLVFPPAYTMFAFVKWKGFMLNSSIGSRDDFPQMYQSLISALGDAIKHLPFREVCLRDTHGLYDLIAADSLDSEFAVLLDSNNSDLLPKAAALVPLRARLFLNALVDCKLPPSALLKQDDGNRMYGQGGELRADEVKDKLVHVLDTLQPAKIHWQWVELRLLLNEQAVIEKLEAHDMSLVEAVRSVSPNPEKAAASENENNFVEIILTRLLVRPDAAPLFSEVVHLLGRSLEDSMLLQTKWFLGGNDVLYGRKSIRQRLINIAESKNLSTRLLYWKPWGWCPPNPQPSKTKGNKRKLEPNPIEEGDIVDGVESRLPGRDPETLVFSREHVTERAFIELILPCVDQGSDDSRTTFASDIIKQMNNIEQQISTVTRGATKSSGSVTPGIESGTSGKSSGRKGMRGGSPGLVRRSVGATESVPPSPAALRASLSLRLQFLLRLLPIICSDREQSVRNMRHTLAAVILRLIGSRVVHEDAANNFSSFTSSSKRDADSLMESFATASVVSCGESLFDRLLLVLHGLLSSSPPSWLKSKPGLRSTTSESFKDFGTFDREMVENLQNELDRMQLPDSIRWRVQTAMPVLLPSVRCSISCQPPSVASSSLGILQSSNPISVVQACNSVLPPKNAGSLLRTVTKANKPVVQQEGIIDLEVDPWSLLEDGAGAQSSSSGGAVSGGSGDPTNLRALNWLKGTVRVRRSEMTYIGAIDEDS